MGNVVRFPRAFKPMLQRPQPVARQANQLGVGDRLIGVVWLTIALIGPLVRFPLACWCFIELVRIAFGHPAWHFFAYFAVLVFMYWFMGVYVPKDYRGKH